MKRYALYRRVSTEEQSRPGHVSLDAQLAECQRYVTAVNGVIVAIEQDVQTGHAASREGYQRVKDAARGHEIDAIIVWKLDRFGRNFREWINAVYELEQEIGIAVESVTDSNDPLTRNIMMSVAEQYLRDLSKHTINGLRYRAARGEWSGAPPLGYLVERKDGVSKLVLDANANEVRQLFEAAATGKHSLARIADLAKALGLRGRTEHFISRQAIGKILRNPTYCGSVVYGRVSNGKFKRRGPQPEDEWTVAEGAHPAIVDAATFAAVQQALTNHRSEQGTVRHTRHLLTSLVYCAVCAGTPGPDGQARAWRMYGHGSKTPVYECSRRKMYGECSLGSFSAVGFEAAVKALVVESFDVEAEVRREAAGLIQAEIDDRRTAAEHQRRQLERELAKHMATRLDLARQRMGMAGSVIPEDVYAQLEADEARAIMLLEREITSLPVSMEMGDVMNVLDFVGSITWADFTDEEWRQLVTLLIAGIDVKSRTEFVVRWQPSADILRQAVAKVSRFGS